jgi:tripartite-type tricarboxylate transporter receptor subunit TctC
MPMRSWVWAATAIIAAASGSAKADPVADFYKGKTVTITVGLAPGGIYSNMAHTIARHIGRHIPGEPNVIAQNMPGAGGTIAINHLYNVAAQDGTVLHTPNTGLTKRVLLGEPEIKYDPLKFHWLGSWGEPIAECTLFRPVSPVQSIREAQDKEVIIGALGTATTTYTNPIALNNIIGTKFKLVPGYKGGGEIRIAMERGEVHGFCGQYESWSMSKPEWLKDNKVIFLVQFVSKRAPELPDVPTAAELGRNDAERQLLSLLSSGPEDRAFVAPPGVPKDRVAALEKAYSAMLKDPKFIEDAERQQFPITPTSAQAIRDYVNDLLKIPPDIIAKLKEVTGRN